MKALAGLAIVAAHAAAFVALASRCHGTDLEVALAAPMSLDGRVPDALADRVVVDEPRPGPGLARRRWTVGYRGGYTRTVGATELVGPFQEPAAHACTGRVVVGQRLLDDGAASAGTIAGAIAKRLDAELRDQGFFPIGDYKRVEHVALRWSRLEEQWTDIYMVRFAPHGYVRIAATVVFDRVEVPIVVALVPELANGALSFRIVARAELDFKNRFFNWVSDELGGDKLATRLAREQLDEALVTTLAPPPPFTLPGGATLTFTYCDEPPEITDGKWATLPFAVAIHRLDANPRMLPPKLGPGPRPPPSPATALALDLDLDALNALLYELWRTGELDRQLDVAGLDRRFNTDPVVTELLSIRISPIRLALPPVVAPGPRGLRLAAEARVAIADGSEVTTGRVWGGVDFALPFAADLGALELSCERGPTTLVPCYADLVDALRSRGDEFHGALTRAFVGILDDIFVERRLGAPGLSQDLVIRAARPSIVTTATNATVRFDLDAALAPAK